MMMMMMMMMMVTVVCYTYRWLTTTDKLWCAHHQRHLPLQLLQQCVTTSPGNVQATPAWLLYRLASHTWSWPTSCWSLQSSPCHGRELSTWPVYIVHVISVCMCVWSNVATTVVVHATPLVEVSVVIAPLQLHREVRFQFHLLLLLCYYVLTV